MITGLRIVNTASKQIRIQRNIAVCIKKSRWALQIRCRSLSSDANKKSESQGGTAATNKQLPKQYKFMSVGHILLDHTARLPNSEIGILKKFNVIENTKGILDVKSLRELKKEACKRVKCVESPGGSALNTVRLLKQLGNNSLFIGLVGDDEAGRKLRKYFKEHDIDVRLFTHKELPTGECLSIINKDTHTETLYANIGASESISVELMQQAEKEVQFLRPTERKQLIYVEGFIIPGRKKLCEYMIKNYVSGRRWLALNLSAEFIVRENFEEVMAYACAAYFIFGNGNEFCALAHRMGFGNDTEKAIRKIFKYHCGPRIMIITNDKNSVILVSNVEYGSDKPGKIFYRECKVDKIPNVVDTTGAGDSFVAGFLHAFLNNYKLKDCVVVGSAVASKVITTIGCNLPKDFNINEVTDKMTKMK
uniref:adenosine kinase n=1 Tax=Bactrocera dorsalis TaxID=27457 RepID=A0A034WBF3_BACDO